MRNSDFLEQMIIKVDPEIDDAGLEMMVSDAEPILEERVYTNIMAKLDEEGRKGLIALTSGEKLITGEVYKYLSGKIQGYEGFIKEVYEKFEKMYKENYKDFLNNK